MRERERKQCENERINEKEKKERKKVVKQEKKL